MRRLALVLFVVGVLALGAPVAAEPGAGLNQQVSGPFTGTSVFDFSTPTCLFIHQVHNATYTTTNGRAGSFDLDGCVAFRGFLYSGLFVLTTPNGAILNGTVTGVVASTVAVGPCGANEFPASLDFTLAPMQGTKNFGHATGTIHLTGTWCSPGIAGVPGPIFGALSADLQPN